ncbi:linker histone H1M isoform X2 [Antennarius striatus]|uniref:linker histone H1M isoform X2 n=1 Tax=Antennarius striatus TaxID=241820 RepID=UPI0035AFE47E
MPPKKPVSDPTAPPAPPSGDVPVEKKPGGVRARKPATHPSTAIMVKEALTALDSRKGVSFIAIQNYIKDKHPTVDESRMKNLVRKALKKGLETGTLVRPVKSGVVTGAVGRFRLPPKEKGTKPNSENIDPNVQKAPKTAKERVKRSPKAGATKKKEAAKEHKSQEDSNPPKKSKKEKEDATSKDAPAKKPKGKTKGTAEEDEGASASAKPKAASQKTREGSKASAAKATGRGKKTAA